MAYRLLFWMILVSFSRIEAQKSQCDLDKFETNDIVPTLISTIPQNPMQIEYKDQPATCGNFLTLNVSRERPTVMDYKAEVQKLYTLIMFDPDAPTPQKPTYANFVHWLIENIPENRVINGDTVHVYNAPSPPSGSDPHRYIFLVYEQPNRQMMNDDFGTDRAFFNLKQFVKDRQLKGPIAGNFFLSSS